MWAAKSINLRYIETAYTWGWISLIALYSELRAREPGILFFMAEHFLCFAVGDAPGKNSAGYGYYCTAAGEGCSLGPHIIPYNALLLEPEWRINVI